MERMRIGFGFDVHAFLEGRKLFLGGVEIPYEKGLAGHSDGDVLIHAISDAILGAAAEDDIGVHFPDTDPAIAGIAGERILAHVTALVVEKGFHIVNVDTVIVCERPKVQPHREAIRERIASILGIGKDRVSVKGKTTERLGFTGREEGIAAYAVCLLERT
jgi:2-C-methyl-D-erythritol 2,4-cyclodiphosphate synthase